MEQNDEKHEFTRQEIEQHLQSALAAATPNVWAKLDLSLPQDEPPKHPAILRLGREARRWGVAAACVCLLLGGGVYHYEYVQVASVVGIDVNPSLRISLNRREKVLKAEALNTDGETVLEDELRGKTLETALGQVVDSLVAKGYLKEGQQEQAVLVSVSGKSRKSAEKVKAAAAANMEEAIAQNQVSAVVYDQTLQVTRELEDLAEAYQVSVGKAGFIEQLVQENEALSQDAQAAYASMMSQPMEAIAQEISEHAYAVSTQVNVVRVEPAAGSSRRKMRGEGQEEALSGEASTKDAQADKVQENPSGEERFETENFSLGGEGESRLEAEKAENIQEQTKDNDEDTREDLKKSSESKKTKQEDARKDKDGSENRGFADKTEEGQKPQESEGKKPKENAPDGEATSSTAGTEIDKEEGVREPEESEAEEETLEKEISGENSRMPLVEYGQPLKGEAGQEELVVGGELLDYSQESPTDTANPAAEDSGLEEDKSPEAEAELEGESKEAEAELDARSQEAEAELEAESREAEPALAESQEVEDAQETEDAGVKPEETGEEGTESAEGTENAEGIEAAEAKSDRAKEETINAESAPKAEGQATAGKNAESSQTKASTISENQETENPTTAESQENESPISAGSQEAESSTVEGSQKTENLTEAESREAEHPAEAESREAEYPAEAESRQTENPTEAEIPSEDSKALTATERTPENPEDAGADAEAGIASREPEDKAEGQSTGREDAQEKESSAQKAQSEDGNARQEDRSQTATQIIRVKVETKEWKEPEKPVFASQFLGFSHRRLLNRGPGAFSFILADPNKLKAKEDYSEEDAGEEAEDGQEETSLEEISGAEDEFGLDGGWEMGEWLHIGPGYLP